MLNEGIVQRKEKIEEFQKKINEVMPSVRALRAPAVGLQKCMFC